MSIDKKFNTARNKVAALSLATLVAFSNAACANENNIRKTSFSYGSQTGLCADYERDKNGSQLGAFGSANKFSEAEENDIGIVLYTGNNLPPEKVLQAGEKFAAVFEKNGLKAKCFAGDHNDDKGTRVLFLVNGQIVPETRGLAISQAITEIDNVASEARIVRQSGIKGNPDYLVSAVRTKTFD